MTLRGRTAVVTGAERGLGAMMAKALAREGARVLLTSKHLPEKTCCDIEAAGGEAVAHELDVTEEHRVESFFAGLETLDILVNNAGVSLEKPLLETTMAEFDALMAVNLRGSFMVGRAAIRRLVARGAGGRVINIASDLGFLGRETFSVYCASKAAILGLTRSWAREFAPGILVNAICPGPMDTDMLGVEQMSPEWRRKEEDNPMGRVGDPEEIAGAVVFLAGPGATFVTGQALGVNGGSHMP